ncbi:hypothetical protein GCM10025868_13420 [Angustibacter aerolatus]|uniref:OBG-type G domain-containing protein n=1 Tax=Angustibacter aerolatus TaxID=1162965 RepID=A0ABQ6JE83_9ACTN|nr:GTPase [Angustibacter aerolatus]GMA86092.1 hypothetical protein GCM10025868_13420 [Angustibacter aerolatus]
MALTIGIVGLPNVGKSTLFNALTKNDVLAANYPFATIEPNVGVVPLPDKRLDRLSEIHGSAKILPATVSFVDIAGIVKGASEGEGLGNKFLANIREADAICQVIRAFDDPDVVHVDGRVDPASDIETINTELILADLQTLENAVPRLEKEVRGKKADPKVLAAAQAAQQLLEGGTTLYAGAAKAGIEPGRPARAVAAHREAVPLRVQPRRGRPRRHRQAGRACATWWRRPRRSTSTRRSSPSSPRLDAEEAAEPARRHRPGRVGPRPGSPASASTPSACRPT